MKIKIGKFIKRKKVLFPLLSLTLFCPIIYYSILHTNEKIDFNSEIRPILNAKCISCHGGVKRLGGFSLLFPSEALAVSESGKRAIVPGKPEESEMMKRILSHDKKLRMPLGAPRMSDEEIEKIKKWIAQGAKWDDHWAYVKPKKVSPPDINNPWIKNDIDRFILARLEKEGLKPSPEADRATLIRRLSLDLIGIPPTPAEVSNFMNDKSPNAYEKLVNRLQASPHYGERWAALWLDLARYADSKGWVDQRRYIWKYRDWVISAFNQDKPFDKFTIEQLAGDLLPKPTDNQLIASAFHRNAVSWDDQLADADDIEEVRVAEVLDRVNTTWQVWQATTMSCVQCHSHPSDPFRHDEFYKFSAYFNNIDDNNSDGPVLNFYTVETDKKVKEVCRWIYKNEGKTFPEQTTSTDDLIMKTLSPMMTPGSCAESRGIQFKSQGIAGNIADSAFIKYKGYDLNNIGKVSYIFGSKGNGGFVEIHIDSIRGKLISKTQLDSTGGWSNWNTKMGNVESVKGIHDVYFIFREHKKVKNKLAGMFDIRWIYLHPELSNHLYEASAANGSKGLKFKPNGGAGFIQDSAFLKFNKMDLNGLDQISFLYGSKGNGGFVEIHSDALRGKLIGKIELLPTGEWTNWKMATADILPIKGLHDIYFVFKAHQKVENKFAGMFDIRWIHPHSKADLNPSVEIYLKREELINVNKNFVPIMKERPADSTKRKTFVFIRGVWTQHGAEVQPGVPGSLNPMVKGEANDTRLGMAKWLISKENPLTARVTVNRFWEQLFGNGIVETVEDFGTRGAKPMHPELLDWLALQFMNEQHWSMKKAIKQIVMSATYRQSSKVSPEMAERDPKNELLARGARVRLSSEQIRDQSLAVSGILSKKMFGPSVMPYQPKGIFFLHPSDTTVKDWVTSPGEDRNRRGLYTYWKRLSPQPSMQAFDSPDRALCVSRRVRTNTPLQALVTLNDTTYFVAARAFAERMMKEGGKNIEKQIQYGYKLALVKDPKPAVNAELNDLYKNIKAYYQNHPEETKELLGTNNTDLASMTIVARTILNLDGFIMKE